MSDEKNEKEVAAVLPLNQDKAFVVTLNEQGPTGFGLAEKMVEGKPINGPLLSLESRPDGLYNVSRIHVGPAQVATAQYRNNYDRIFNKSMN